MPTPHPYARRSGPSIWATPFLSAFKASLEARHISDRRLRRAIDDRLIDIQESAMGADSEDLLVYVDLSARPMHEKDMVLSALSTGDQYELATRFLSDLLLEHDNLRSRHTNQKLLIEKTFDLRVSAARALRDGDSEFRVAANPVFWTESLQDMIPDERAAIVKRTFEIFDQPLLAPPLAPPKGTDIRRYPIARLKQAMVDHQQARAAIKETFEADKDFAHRHTHANKAAWKAFSRELTNVRALRTSAADQRLDFTNLDVAITLVENVNAEDRFSNLSSQRGLNVLESIGRKVQRQLERDQTLMQPEMDQFLTFQLPTIINRELDRPDISNRSFNDRSTPFE